MKKNKLILIYVITFMYIFTGCKNEFVDDGIKIKEAIEIVEKIIPNYYEVNLIFNGYIDTKNDVVRDENEKAYMEVNTEKYKSINDIKNLLYSIFTTDYIAKKYDEIFESDYPPFKEIDGELHVAVISGVIKHGSDNSIEKIDFLEKNSFSAVIKFGEDENQIVKYIFYFKKINDNWLIDDIETI